MRVAIIGAGWSGLSVATFLRERGQDVTMHEAGHGPGGRIRTHREDGHLVEAGPHGVIPSDAATKRLLDISGVPLVTAPAQAPRFVVHRGRSVELPAKPPQVLKTPLLTTGAKLRLFTEPLHRTGPDGETVGSFARRRLGRGARDLVDAFVSGVYAGDPDRLVLKHAFPELHRMDATGGLLRNLKKPTHARPLLTSAREGMESLVRALAAKLDIVYDSPVTSATESATSVTITTSQGREDVDHAVLATDPEAVRRILGLPIAAPPLAPVHIVAFGMPDDAGPPEGYGMLSPEREGRFALGALFESRLFPGRAPVGQQLVRCLIGGRRHPERVTLAPDEIARKAWNDLVELSIVRGEPTRTFHLKTQGIPQPEEGQSAWLSVLPHRRIHVLGIGHRAVGLNALAAEAHQLAQRLA